MMDLYTQYMKVYLVESSYGSTDCVPAELVGADPELEDFVDYVEGKPVSFEAVEGWFARYSAPGYLDCTPWVGPFDTEKRAANECMDLYGSDEDE